MVEGLWFFEISSLQAFICIEHQFFHVQGFSCLNWNTVSNSLNWHIFTPSPVVRLYTAHEPLIYANHLCQRTLKLSVFLSGCSCHCNCCCFFWCLRQFSWLCLDPCEDSSYDCSINCKDRFLIWFGFGLSNLPLLASFFVIFRYFFLLKVYF